MLEDDTRTVDVIQSNKVAMGKNISNKMVVGPRVQQIKHVLSGLACVTSLDSGSGFCSSDPPIPPGFGSRVVNVEDFVVGDSQALFGDKLGVSMVLLFTASMSLTTPRKI